MFVVDEPTAQAIRRAFDERGELAAIAELRRHFPLLVDGDQARACVRTIASWRPRPSPAKLARAARKPSSRR